MKSRIVLEKQKRKKIFATVIIAVAFIYIAVSFTTSPFKADYKIETPDYKDDKLIALTFDDGPGKYTETLLDGLKKNNAKATFFILGKKVEANAETVKRIKNEGHLIGSHTYSHISLFENSLEAFKSDLNAADSEFEKVIGEKPVFFRPPHGWYLGTQLNKIDKIALLWEYDPADWKYEDADYVYNYIMKHARDGAVILLHDTKKTTVEGALRAVEELTAKGGYRFVRADELLCRNGGSLKCGLAYRWCRNGKKPFYF